MPGAAVAIFPAALGVYPSSMFVRFGRRQFGRDAVVVAVGAASGCPHFVAGPRLRGTAAPQPHELSEHCRGVVSVTRSRHSRLTEPYVLADGHTMNVGEGVCASSLASAVLATPLAPSSPPTLRVAITK